MVGAPAHHRGPEVEQAESAALFGTADAAEGISAFLQKRRPEY
jgi:enoyl-CoA hydratase/carnithine racemase